VSHALAVGIGSHAIRHGEELIDIGAFELTNT
jgi:hypothetical protein